MASTKSGAPGAGPSLDPEQQLLAWLSGTVAAAQLSVAGRAPGGSATAPGSQGSAQSGPPDASLSGLPALDPLQGANAALAANAWTSHLAAPAHAAAANSTTATLQSPLGTTAWVEELGAQLGWLAHRGIESASLHVSPAELGPIEVRIAVHGTDASVWFGAAQAGTRAALEHALPQLHRLFASQGLALADAGVFREPPRQSARQGLQRSLSPAGAVRDDSARTPELRAAARIGLVDLYA